MEGTVRGRKESMKNRKSEITDEQIEKLARTLKEKFLAEKRATQYAKVKEVLALLAAGTFLPLAIIMPSLPLALKPFLKEHKKDWEEWKRYNPFYLHRTIKRLEKQKLVKIKERGKKQIVEITDQGKKKILKYALDGLEIKRPKSWDGKWRLIIYDIPEKQKRQRDIFRDHLISLKFLHLQDSVFLYPFPCEDEVEFLRQFYNLGKHIIIIEVKGLENEAVYRKYFGL